jgi:hypothetical protein
MIHNKSNINPIIQEYITLMNYNQIHNTYIHTYTVHITMSQITMMWWNVSYAVRKLFGVA